MKQFFMVLKAQWHGFRHAYKRILLLAKPEWPTLALATVFLLAGSAMTLIFPEVTKTFVDGIFSDGLKSIDKWALILVGVFLIQGFAVAFRHFLFTVAGARVVTRLQSDIFNRIMHQEIGFFDQRKTGELLNRLASDTAVLQNAVSVNISELLRNIIMIVGGVSLLVLKSPMLTLVMLAVFPPVVVAALYFGKLIQKMSKIVQDMLANASEAAEEGIAQIRTVRSFAKEGHESGKYRGHIETAFRSIVSRTKALSIFQGLVSFAAYGALALILWYGGRQVHAGLITIGDLTAFLMYTLMVAGAMGAVGGLYASFMAAAGSAERIFEIQDRVPDIPLVGGKTLEKVEGALVFDKLTFAYPTRPDEPALKDINFKIEPGEIVALVGPSGSGKSTIASLITRFYDPQEGHILLDGEELIGLNPTWLRGEVGVVQQEPALFGGTIEYNIGYGLEEYTREQIVEAAKVANAHDFIETFAEGYETEVGERGVRLSGGQKQRIAIARAILKDPRILILDEATSALDAESEHLVKQALDRLMQGRTTLIIAHRLSTVKDAKRVIVMESGGIVELGTHEELMGKDEGIYRKLIEQQFVATGSMLSTATPEPAVS